MHLYTKNWIFVAFKKIVLNAYKVYDKLFLLSLNFPISTTSCNKHVT